MIEKLADMCGIGGIAILVLGATFALGKVSGSTETELKYSKAQESHNAKIREIQDTNFKTVQTLQQQNKELNNALSQAKQNPVYQQHCIDALGLQHLNNAITQPKK